VANFNLVKDGGSQPNVAWFCKYRTFVPEFLSGFGLFWHPVMADCLFSMLLLWRWFPLERPRMELKVERNMN
jgi:hypothetical protein